MVENLDWCGTLEMMKGSFPSRDSNLNYLLILEVFDVLLNFPFTTSETMHDYYL